MLVRSCRALRRFKNAKPIAIRPFSSSSHSSSPSSSSSSSSLSAAAAGHAATHISHHWRSPHLPSGIAMAHHIEVSHAQGSWVHSTDGKSYLDFTCGIGVTNLGHCHPAVNKAAIDQIGKGVHLQVNCVTSQPMLNLADKLSKVLPKQLNQYLFSNSGAESIENAVKLARHATGRTNVIVMQGGFHGRTIAAGSLTTAKAAYRSGFQPSMAGVFVVPYAYCHRCPCSIGQPQKFNESSCCNEPINQLRQVLKQQTGPEETAAILFEPILGEGGYVVPPKSFIKALRQIADETGALLIADEVQTGFGRTGTLFAFEQFGVIPDILVMAKGIANGFPLSGIATSSALLSKARPGSIGGTYGGNAVACAAACAVLDTIEKERILENVNARGAEFKQGLLALKKKGYPISDIRGLGLMIGVEFSDSAGAGVASKVLKAANKNGLLLLTTGIYESLRLIAPLTVSKQEVAMALEKLEAAFVEVFGQK